LASYRRRIDIIAAVLGAVDKGATKTQVMYRANLSYKLLTKYLNQVLEFGFVHFEVGEGQYIITIKGKRFLGRYEDYLRHNKRIERHIDNMRTKRKALEELCSDKGN